MAADGTVEGIRRAYWKLAGGEPFEETDTVGTISDICHDVGGTIEMPKIPKMPIPEHHNPLGDAVSGMDALRKHSKDYWGI